MELLFSLVTGVLSASGIYLLLRGRTFSIIVGLALLSYAVNLFYFNRRLAHPCCSSHWRFSRAR